MIDKRLKGATSDATKGHGRPGVPGSGGAIKSPINILFLTLSLNKFMDFKILFLNFFPSFTMLSEVMIPHAMAGEEAVV